MNSGVVKAELGGGPRRAVNSRANWANWTSTARRPYDVRHAGMPSSSALAGVHNP